MQAEKGRHRRAGLNDGVIAFGPFRLYPARQVLLKGQVQVPVGSRALLILIALAERAGELVTKDELFARAWPNLSVEESNLRAQIAVLRRALCDNGSNPLYIVAVPGRGYRFAAPISRAREEVAPGKDGGRKVNLPIRLTQIIGRNQMIETLLLRFKRSRFLTVIGPGGIGKTTVAIAAAKAMAEHYEDCVCFLDATSLADASLLPAELAAALGFAIMTHDAAHELAHRLREKQLLIVLDNCERIAEAAARLAEEILKAAPQVRILTTSREPLRAEGEHVFRLPPLETPPVVAGLTADQALRFPAVELFAERAAARIDGFELTDADAPIVADICRQLDGIALAIELAAARVDVFGLRGIAERLNDRFSLLAGGRRTAVPRHQALEATLDWSYEALSEAEKLVLCHLSIFTGGFTLDSAAAVLADVYVQRSEILELLANLIEKSLVAADIGDADVRYRLLETTRLYCASKLASSGKLPGVSRRHAEYFCAHFETALSERDMHSGADWLARYGRETDNIRAALDWAFSAGADVRLGTALTLAAIPLWFQLSATDECRNRVQHALTCIGPGEAMGAYARQIMELYVTLGMSQTFTIGLAPQASAAWAKALEIAEELGDREFQLEALWGLWFCQIGAGEYRAALESARRFSALAETTGDRLLGDRLTGVPLHCLGNHVAARVSIERSLGGGTISANPRAGIRYRFDQPMAARVILPQMLWLQGFPDQAMDAARNSLEEARATGHAISVCDALAQAAIPIAMFTGDIKTVEGSITSLLDHSGSNGLGPWRVLARCWRGSYAVKHGNLADGIAELKTGLDALREVRFAFYHTQFMATLAEGLAASGQLQEANALIDQAVVRCRDKEELWCVAELLRIQGEIKLQETSPHLERAEQALLQALETARQQGALSLELRAAASLARYRCSRGCEEEARTSLVEVYNRFTEGFGTRDLIGAKALIDELACGY